jgi:hypothetical protein
VLSSNRDPLQAMILMSREWVANSVLWLLWWVRRFLAFYGVIVKFRAIAIDLFKLR